MPTLEREGGIRDVGLRSATGNYYYASEVYN